VISQHKVKIKAAFDRLERAFEFKTRHPRGTERDAAAQAVGAVQSTGSIAGCAPGYTFIASTRRPRALAALH
jgi:hypothetical protein